MIIRFFLFTTGILSFIYFLSPTSFYFLKQDENDILGIEKRNAIFNKPTLDTVLLAYCINEEVLPANLNDLYDDYLRESRKLDLDKLYTYTVISNQECKYELSS